MHSQKLVQKLHVFLSAKLLLLTLANSITIEIYIKSSLLNSFDYCTCSADFECIYFLAAFSGACECQSLARFDDVLGKLNEYDDEFKFNSVNLCCQDSMEFSEEHFDRILNGKSMKSIRNEKCLISDVLTDSKITVKNLSKLSMKQIMAEFVWTNSLPDNWKNTLVIIDLDVFGGVDEIKAYSIYLTKQTFIYK